MNTQSMALRFTPLHDDEAFSQFDIILFDAKIFL
jgi:hypothetical protein